MKADELCLEGDNDYGGCNYESTGCPCRQYRRVRAWEAFWQMVNGLKGSGAFRFLIGCSLGLVVAASMHLSAQSPEWLRVVAHLASSVFAVGCVVSLFCLSNLGAQQSQDA
jgi:hypothetical protein